MWAEPTCILDNSDMSECEIVGGHNDLKDHADKKAAFISAPEAEVA